MSVKTKPLLNNYSFHMAESAIDITSDWYCITWVNPVISVKLDKR